VVVSAALLVVSRRRFRSQIELDKCLAAIRNENCDQPIDVIARLTSYRAKTLCTMEPER
jgi:hypothetical protein